MRVASRSAVEPPIDSLVTREMVWIPGGAFLMGSDEHYPEERPAHRVAVDGFWIDRGPVTNAAFRRFVEATGYVTLAERLLVPGSAVFFKATQPVELEDCMQWWRYVPGASWRRPEGPESTIEGRWEHPVVHVGFEDVEAYAQWIGKAIPTEAEWELAARGGLEQAVYAWGDQLMPHGRPMANTWQGEFPWRNLSIDGYERTSPVGAFPPNGFGLFDMIGNVWEWTCDWYSHTHRAPERPCCTPRNPRGGTVSESIDDAVGYRVGRKVLKGGSYLCSPDYCLRYRPAARIPEAIDTTTCHVGFRCVVRGPRAN